MAWEKRGRPRGKKVLSGTSFFLDNRMSFERIANQLGLLLHFRSAASGITDGKNTATQYGVGFHLNQRNSSKCISSLSALN